MEEGKGNKRKEKGRGKARKKERKTMGWQELERTGAEIQRIWQEEEEECVKYYPKIRDLTAGQSLIL